MIHEVRVLDPKKHLKKIITIKELSRRHWSEFEKQQKSFAKPRDKSN
ncbi:MAG: hypothetical protein ACJZ45_07385 [Nitrospinia bacterium]|jgi:hypothetical protein